MTTLITTGIILLLVWAAYLLWRWEPKAPERTVEKSAKESMRLRQRQAKRTVAAGLLLCGLLLTILLLAGTDWSSAKGEAPIWQLPNLFATDVKPPERVPVAPPVTILDDQDKWEKVRYPLKGNLPAGDQQWSFAGILPMQRKNGAQQEVRVDVRMSGADPASTYFLVEGWASGGQPLSGQTLMEVKRESSKLELGMPEKSSGIFPLYGIPFSKRLWNDSEFISSVYLQSATGSGGSTLTTFETGPSVQQWWVELDSYACTSFTLEHSTWEHCWIVPIYDPQYFGLLGSFPVTPKGWSEEEFQQSVIKAGGDPKEPVEFMISPTKAPRMAPYCKIGQEGKVEHPLTEVIVLDRDTHDPKETITLGVNLLRDSNKLAQPIRVIVGVSAP